MHVCAGLWRFASPQNTPIGATYSGSSCDYQTHRNKQSSPFCATKTVQGCYRLWTRASRKDCQLSMGATWLGSRHSPNLQLDETVLRNQPHTTEYDGYATGTSTNMTTDETRTCGAVQPARARRRVAQQPDVTNDPPRGQAGRQIRTYPMRATRSSTGPRL